MNNLSSVNVNNSNPTFGKTILNKVNLRKKAGNTYKFVEGYFSKLNPEDPKDLSLLESIRENWRRGTSFSNEMIYNFEKYKDSTNLYMTELKNSCLGIKKKVCCLIETTNPKKRKDRNNFEIVYVQSAPAISKDNSKYPIKGAGELSIYGAVKEAKKEGFKKVSLLSIKDSFYEHIGFPQKEVATKDSALFTLPQEKYDEFLQRIEKKYNL